jgi:predicted N-acetyltransferase YhbS
VTVVSRWQVVSRWETELTAADHAALRDLLAAAFPRAAAIFTRQSWNLSRKELRIWLADDGDRPLAHLAVQRRLIAAGPAEVLVAGVGEVAVSPAHQRTGLGRALMRALADRLGADLTADYGFLTTSHPLAAFYLEAGWTRIPATVRELDRDAVTVRTHQPAVMIRPGRRDPADWPPGPIDLRGQTW